jgi:hypothetical protein
MYSWEEFGDDFYHNADTAIDVSLFISGVAFTVATLGAGWEVGAALMGGRLGLAGLLRFGAIGAAQGGLIGGGIETGRQSLTSDCPFDYGKIGMATAGGAVAGFILGARGGIGPRGASPFDFHRTHGLSGKASARKVQGIAQSMRAGGYNGPPVKAFEHNGVKYVLDGHHRLAAARQAGLNEVPYESVSASQLGRYGYRSVDELLAAANEAFGR